MIDFINTILIGVVTTLIASAVIFYLQPSGSSLRRAWSLISSAWRLQKVGLGTIITHRKYFSHLKTGSTIPDYIKGAKFSFSYIGFWMAKSTEMEQITDSLRSVLQNNGTVEIIMLSQNLSDDDIHFVSRLLAIPQDSCKSRINSSWELLLDFGRALPQEQQSRLTLRSHAEMISSSCFIVDEGRLGARILVDMKIYGAGRESGITFEIYDNQKSDSLYIRFIQSFNLMKSRSKLKSI